ncbi:MAG: hypothetical protein WD851_15160 [Pirellulales bacterium]
MANYLQVQDEKGTRQLPLQQGVSRLGSSSDCELRLEHDEVQPLALTLDFRGDALLVHNRNPYAVFIGDEELQPSQMTAWPVGAPLRMTRSITLTISGNGAATVAKQAEDEDAPEKSPPSSQRQMIQLGVILLCLGVGYQQMGAEATPSVEREIVKFETLLDAVRTHIEAEEDKSKVRASQWRDVMRLMQEAYFLETRPGQRDTAQAIDAYQRVLETDLIRNAKLQNDNQLESRVFRFATAKKVLLYE